MGKLRDAMQRDMELKNFSPRTMECYLYWMSLYALHYRKPPDELGDKEIKAFLHFLRKEKKASQSTMNQAYSALKFFYETTLGRPWNGKQIPRCKRGKRLPVVLSREEVQSILSATENLKHLTILATIYSGGLRLSEAAELKVSDIDSQRMLIHVRGKGDKDRYTLLGKNALEVLRTYWKAYRPSDYLFPSRDPHKPISVSTIQKIFEGSHQKSGTSKPASVHTLRHCFATHLLESGCDVYYIQRLMGHSSVRTTSVYLHVTRKNLTDIVSPIDMQDLPDKPPIPTTASVCHENSF
jgi:site-specific recombinase XerD